VNAIEVENSQMSMSRLPTRCSLLDVAVGAGAGEVTRYLLEFHSANVNRETMKMALATGSLELIRLVWERLPGGRDTRVDFLEVAADFHRDEPLAWLLRDATDLEREVLYAFALDHRLADAVLLCGPGWSWRAGELAAAWPVASGLSLRPAPAGLSIDCGWWVSTAGTAFPLTHADSGWDSAIDRSTLTELAIPNGLTAISDSAFSWSRHLVKLAIPPSVTVVGERAFWGCRSLTRVEVPASVTSVGPGAYGMCSALRQVTIPASAVLGCRRHIPPRWDEKLRMRVARIIGDDVFESVERGIECLVLTGQRMGWARGIVHLLDDGLPKDALILGRELAGQCFGVRRKIHML
jgi:hypothetical protein